MSIRRAEEKDIEGIRKLLYQVNQVHADGRPDLFKSGGIKYTEDELKEIISDRTRPVFVYDEDEIHEEKCITVAFVGDERICDGYYYANSFKLLSKYLKKPELLEEHGVVKSDIQ